MAAPKREHKGRWSGMDAGKDSSDDQQDIMRGRGMVDDLYQVHSSNVAWPAMVAYSCMQGCIVLPSCLLSGPLPQPEVSVLILPYLEYRCFVLWLSNV